MIVTEAQILAAMDFHEKKYIAEVGPLDMIALPKAVAKLADLLGAMWYQKEQEATLPDSTKTAALLREALGLPDPGPVGTDAPAAAVAVATADPASPDHTTPETCVAATGELSR